MKIEEKYQVLQRLETAKASGWTLGIYYMCMYVYCRKRLFFLPGTTLISLLISGGKDINTVQKMLSKVPMFPPSTP